MSLVKDRTFNDGIGNYCRIEMHQISENTYELFMHNFNCATPARFLGTLSNCIARGELWITKRKEEGFIYEQA